MARLRLFVAVEIEEAIRKRFQNLQEILKGAPGDVRWVDTRNIHITLKFLGYVEEKNITRVKEIIQGSLKGTAPFNVRFEGIGGFPTSRRPRVIVVLAEDASGSLSSVHARLEEGLEELGIEREDRQYKPHLTLGRVKSMRDIEPLVRLLERYSREAFGEQVVTSVLLMQSQLTPQGPIYTRLASFPLGNSG